MTPTRLKIIVQFYISVVITLIFCSFQIIPAFESRHFKLPSAVLPTKYHLHISTYVHEKIFTYNGTVSIDFTIIEPFVKEIVLNSKQLRVFNITLISRYRMILLQTPYQIKYKLDEEKEQLTINWPLFLLQLRRGQQYRLQISFEGDIQQGEERGFFQASNSDGNDYYATHFEPTSARLAFPCFDEPALKAKFIISISHGLNYSAISNMPVVSSTSNEQMITTAFQITPPMSTYLVAFVITNYKHTSTIANGGIEHRFFYPRNSKENGSRALENAIQTVDTLEKILGIQYSLPKLDQIQVKKIFGLAMENWGLMIFQENKILSNQQNYEKLDLLNLIHVQNHEIAHQWFGNLVTPASWNYIWLKEGLSSYFGIVAADLVYPQEKIFEYFLLVQEGQLVSKNLNHSLTRLMTDGANIKEQYDSVAFMFGPSFFRMVHHAIGQSTFMKGINKYLTNFKFTVADEDDFFEAIQAAIDEEEGHLFQNNQSVANVFRTWTHNIGMPVITIIRNYENGTVTIRQKSMNSENKDQKWWIPMNFATASNPVFEETIADYIMPPLDEVTLDLNELNISLSKTEWLIVNKQRTGLFYVVYDDTNLKLIIKALSSNQTTIHPFNRALVFRDLAVTFDEKINAKETLLELLEYMKIEEEPFPWIEAFDLIFKIKTSMPEINSTVHNIFTGMYVKIKNIPEENRTSTDIMTLDNNYYYDFNETLHAFIND